MAWYYQGSVTIAPGSNVVTGTGTQWLANLYGIGEGQALVIGAQRLEIMYVDSDTSLRLALPHTAGYSGSYHIETSYAGTGGDASRQIMACIRRFSTLVVDWNEWMTSTADTMTATDPFGNPVEIATYHAVSKGVEFKDELTLQGYTVKDAEGNDVVINPLKDTQKISNAATNVTSHYSVEWKGSHYMTGTVGAMTGDNERVALDTAGGRTQIAVNGGGGGWRYFGLPAVGGLVATQQWVNQYVGVTIGGGSQLRTDDGTTTIAVNPNGNAGIWESSTNRWLLRANPTVSSMDVTKNIYLINQDPESTSSKVEVNSPDGNTRAGLWAYNDKRVLLSGYKNGSWANIDVHDLANCLHFQPNGAGVSLQSKGARAWFANADGSVGVWNKTRASSDLFLSDNGLTAYTQISIDSPNSYSTLRLWGKDRQQFILETSGGATGVMYWVRRNSAGTNLAYLDMPLLHGGGTVVTSADNSLKSVYVDASGYVKKSSPIVFIRPDGYSTNAESRGVIVQHLGVGEYLIKGVLGYNSDNAWGINGGVSVPKDVNGLELVYIKDQIHADGSILIRTFHRQHAHLPEAFQNSRTGYIDGQPCDIPQYSRIDVRVQMPKDCEYNRILANVVTHECLFNICKAQQDVLSNTTLALPLL